MSSNSATVTVSVAIMLAGGGLEKYWGIKIGKCGDGEKKYILTLRKLKDNYE